MRPEEVVEVAERVRVDRGAPTAEPGDDVAVSKLDDTHAASVENRAVRAVVQRVSRAAVRVDGEVVGACGTGLLVLLGVAVGDTPRRASALAGKVARLRIFPGRQRPLRPVAPRHRRRGARRQPVHADRRHAQGEQAELREADDQSWRSR